MFYCYITYLVTYYITNFRAEVSHSFITTTVREESLFAAFKLFCYVWKVVYNVKCVLNNISQPSWCEPELVSESVKPQGLLRQPEIMMMIGFTHFHCDQSWWWLSPAGSRRTEFSTSPEIIWNLIPVDKFSCFCIYQGYPWYIPVLWDIPGISLVITGYTMDKPNDVRTP